MKYLIFFICLSLHLNAALLVNTRETIELLPHSKIYHDIGNQESIESILKSSDKLVPTDRATIDYCNLVPEGVWIEFKLINPTNKTIEKILKIDNFSLERIDLYKVANKKVLSKETTGIYHLQKFDGLVTLNIPIDVEANSSETYYLNVKNEKLSLWFKPELYDPNKFYKEDTLHQVVWALFFGGILSLVIYNLFLYIFTRDKIYLYYFLYLMATLLQNQLSLYTKLYLLPMDDIDFVKNNLYANVFYANVFVTFTMALFIRKFLDTQLYPKIDFTLKLLIYMLAVYFVLQLFNVFTIPQVVIFQFFTPYYFLWIGFYALYKKNPQAKFFLIGWSFALAAWLSLLFQYMGIFPIKYMFEYIFETLIMAEVILFSISLAYRIKTLEKKKNDLTQTLLTQQRDESIRLEKIVKRRTQELNSELQHNELLLKELHHRVKNNMQFIASLYALKLNDNNNAFIEAKLHDVERKIQAMSIVHEMLYNQKNLVNIDAEEYLQKVIQNIKNSFELDNIVFELHINVTLETEEAIYCGLIVNELVTNALKHAFDANGGTVKISLQNIDGKKLLEVSDNGIGKTLNTEATFGDMMVESLATEQLEGELNIRVQNGTHISLLF